MTFADNAIRLGGHVAWVLGWRPPEFWNATPHELVSILNAGATPSETPPDAAAMHKLLELFPDG